jgi:carboxypeptidase PM20D1
MDVVPVEPGTEADWTHPPFSGAIADGFIWGRGTMDMKASLTGILEAVEHLITQGFVPARTVYLTFSHDEEVGGSNGTAKIAELLEERGVRLDYTLDEGLVITHGIVPGVDKPAALVGLAEKGAVVLELSTRGEGGHSSRPLVSTAVGKLARAIHRLETNQMPARLDSPVADMFTYLAPEMPFAWRVALANRWLSDPWLIPRLEKTAATNASIRTTTAPTIIRGGVKSNVLPRDARAVVDFRILPGDTIAGVIEHVRATIDDPDITIRQVGREPSEPSPVSGVETSSFSALRKTIHQVFPDVVVAPGLVIGRTDSRRYAKIADNSYRFLPMRLGPEDLKRIHGVDERIAVNNYLEIVRFYVQFLKNTTTTWK